MNSLEHPLEVHYLGQCDYESVWRKMQDFTDRRSDTTADQFWVVEHPPVFTLGQNGKPEHLLDPGDIPVIQVDRGGQVTYHGPGQLVVYVLINLKRYRLGVRQLVTALESAIIKLLAGHGIEAVARPDAPGVYINHAKVASLGLKIRKGCSYHGLAINVDLDLEPFNRINPCGFEGLAVTRLKDHGVERSSWELATELCEHLHNEILV